MFVDGNEMESVVGKRLELEKRDGTERIRNKTGKTEERDNPKLPDNTLW